MYRLLSATILHAGPTPCQLLVTSCWHLIELANAGILDFVVVAFMIVHFVMPFEREWCVRESSTSRPFR